MRLYRLKKYLFTFSMRLSNQLRQRTDREMIDFFKPRIGLGLEYVYIVTTPVVGKIPMFKTLN